ncbi:hypothetical protein M0R45_014310 [Rubus argutus]|uniref:Uncharacterized protein n=1 Tax=Rubus argutus TaxID=59490 RepID=A0AAW1XNK3_RUBAR
MYGGGEWGQSIGAEEAGNVGFDDDACRLIGVNSKDLRRSGDVMVLCCYALHGGDEGCDCEIEKCCLGEEVHDGNYGLFCDQ